MKYYHIILLIILNICISQNSINGNLCGLSDSDINTQLEQYETSTPICIVIRTNTTYAVKTRFWPEVDDFAALELSDSSQADFLSGNQVQIQAQYGNKVSPNITYSYTASSILYKVPFFTLLATVDDGIVTDLSWDTGCFTCDQGTDKCLASNNVCAVKASDCSNFNNCDLRVYMAWLGTDKNGHYMTSAGSVFSRFNQYSVSSVYNSAASTSLPNPDLPV